MECSSSHSQRSARCHLGDMELTRQRLDTLPREPSIESATGLNGRRKMPHVRGASTGPRTAEGLARSPRARWKHGQYSAAAQAEQKRVRELLAQSRELLKQKPAERSAARCMGFIPPFLSLVQ
jgi:hypothetical protein